MAARTAIFNVVDQSQLLSDGQSSLGYNGQTKKLAMSFTPTMGNLTGIAFRRAANVGNPVMNIHIDLRTDNADVPSSTILTSYNMTAAEWTSNSVGVDIPVALAYDTTPETLYHIVWDPSLLDNSNYVQVQRKNSDVYARGKERAWGGTAWDYYTRDTYFKTYHGKLRTAISATRTDATTRTDAAARTAI